jgi:hypothetical protein
MSKNGDDNSLSNDKSLSIIQDKDDIVKRIYLMHLVNQQNQDQEQDKDSIDNVADIFATKLSEMLGGSTKYQDFSKEYDNGYNEFASKQTWRNLDFQLYPEKNIAQSIITTDSGIAIASVKFKTKQVNGITLYDLDKLESLEPDSKLNTTVKMSMYDKDGKNEDGLSIIVGIDKNGKKFISAPADIVIDGVTDISSNVKIKRGGKEYFMPITYKQYEDLHNEMLGAKINAISSRIAENNSKDFRSKIEENLHNEQSLEENRNASVKKYLNEELGASQNFGGRGYLGSPRGSSEYVDFDNVRSSFGDGNYMNPGHRESFTDLSRDAEEIIDEQKKIINEQRGKINSLESLGAAQEKSIEEKDREITALKEELLKQKRLIEEQKKVVEEQPLIIAARDEAIIEQNRLKEEQIKKDKEFDTFIKERDEIIEKQEKKNKKFKSDIEERDKIINNQIEQIEEKVKTIDEQKKEIDLYVSKYQSIESSLAGAEIENQHLKLEIEQTKKIIDEKIEENSYLQEKITSQSKTIDELNIIAGQTKQENKELNQEIDEIKVTNSELVLRLKERGDPLMNQETFAEVKELRGVFYNNRKSLDITSKALVDKDLSNNQNKNNGNVK